VKRKNGRRHRHRLGSTHSCSPRRSSVSKRQRCHRKQARYTHLLTACALASQDLGQHRSSGAWSRPQVQRQLDHQGALQSNNKGRCGLSSDLGANCFAVMMGHGHERTLCQATATRNIQECLQLRQDALTVSVSNCSTRWRERRNLANNLFLRIESQSPPNHSFFRFHRRAGRSRLSVALRTGLWGDGGRGSRSWLVPVSKLSTKRRPFTLDTRCDLE
jgi:hypothetical protein